MVVIRYLIGIFLAVFAASWVFNHVDPWLGIGSVVVMAYLLVWRLKVVAEQAIEKERKLAKRKQTRR